MSTVEAAGAVDSTTTQELPFPAIELLNFWFGPTYWRPPTGTQGRVYDELWTGRWFAKEDAQRPVDEHLRRCFADELERAAAGEADDWLATPNGTLALIILLDQVSRNVHRGTPAAFANDARALDICLRGLDAGVDRQLRPIARTQFYMPLVHAESLALQQRAVDLFAELLRAAPEDERFIFERWARVSERHRWVIAAFGRYPERNPILGRAHTPAEEAYMASTYQPPK